MSYRWKTILQFGFSIAFILCVLKWLDTKFHLNALAIDSYISVTALIFTILGAYLAKNIFVPRLNSIAIKSELIIESDKKSENVVFNKPNFGLTKRELEVLREMSLGYSNKEIADKLNLSVPTIKSHASNLFEKMDVKRRTQAIDKGKSLKIIP